MMIVRMLRWLFGYIRFTLEGTFPERFLNLASRRGIPLWGLTHEDNTLSAMARQHHRAALQSIAEKTNITVGGIEYHGLPYCLKRYRHRVGLLIGLIVFGLGCHYLSGIVWSIDIRTPSLLNEYEVREMLREHGLTEGTPAKQVDAAGIINQISVSDRRVSWMTVNIMDTHADINISPNLASVVQRPETLPLSNMKSIADGTVTKVEVYKGAANVRVGDGIRKNQLLVSGLVEYTNGQIVLTDCEARVFARTHRSVDLHLPKRYTLPRIQETVTKQTMTLFGLSLPLTIQGNPSGTYAQQTTRQQVTLLGHPLPIYVTEENWRHYENVPVELTLPQAQELLQQKLSLYEFFMLAGTQQGTVLNRQCTVTEESDGFVLHADYELEEDVCQKTVIPLEETAEEPASPLPAV